MCHTLQEKKKKLVKICDGTCFLKGVVGAPEAKKIKFEMKK